MLLSRTDDPKSGNIEFIEAFHPLMYYPASENRTVQLYMCLSRESVIFVDMFVAIASVSATGISAEEVEAYNAFPVTQMPYHHISEIIVHAQMEDRFGSRGGRPSPRARARSSLPMR